MSNAHINGNQPGSEATDSLEVMLRNALSNGTINHETITTQTTTNLTPQEQRQKMNEIAEIFHMEEEESPEDEEMIEMDEDETDPAVDLEDRRRRTERLKGVMSALAHLCASRSTSDQMDVAVEKIADGSRDPRWRIPIGDSGVLEFLLDIFSSNSLGHTLKIHTLRVIGNSCADTDENRARVVASDKYLPSIIVQLQVTSLLPFAIPVMYNICIDYEPAQKLASDSFLSKALIELLASPRLEAVKTFLGYICKILNLLVAQPSELEVAPEEAPIVLLGIAVERESPVDMDGFIALTNTAIAYLRNERFQKALIARGSLDLTLTVLVDSYTRFDSHPSIGDDQDDLQAVIDMRSNFNQTLSDISALPKFQQACPVVSPFSSSLRRWLLSSQLQLQVCACIMLGNLARSDEACIEFIHTSRVHIPLIKILSDTHDSQLLHASLGFLKNLALPLKNKEIIGQAGIFEILPRLWALDTLPQIQFSSISLARQLTIGTFKNVRLCCQRLTQDDTSPAYDKTNLSLLISLFDRTDNEAIKMEISRLLTSVCRVTSTTTERTPDQLTEMRKKFYLLHPDIGRPLGFMVSQTKWPVVRSEGWFVFALMARYPEGAVCISDLMHDVSVFGPLVEMLTGKKLVDYEPATTSSITTPTTDNATSTAPEPSPANAPLPNSPAAPPPANSEEMSRIDRENALVLISELLKNRGQEMALMRRTLFEDLLKGGSEIVLSYQDAKGGAVNNVERDKRPRAGFGMGEIMEQGFNELA